MPYVPVPQGAKSVATRDDIVVPYRRVGTDGKVTTGSRIVAAVGNRLSYGAVTRVKGKPITLKGKKWSPVRAYYRHAEVVTPLPGPTVIRNVGGAVTTWFGSGLATNYDQVSARSALMDSGWSTNMRNRVNTELLVKIGQRKVSWGESIAEGRQTLSHLASTVSTVVRAILAARKGRWNQVPRILGVPKKKLRDGTSAAERWLEYQFGWLPLLGDIYDSYELYKKGLSSGPQLFSAVRNISESLDESKSLTNSYRRPKGSTKIRHSAKIFARISDNDISALQQLGLINPVEVAWALVPFSFVVDWFLPIGSVLEAVSARVGVTFVDGFYGRSVVSRYQCEDVTTAPLNVRTSGGFVTATDAFAYRRERMSSMPWPGFYLKSPFSTSHVVSALALVRQLWR